MLQLGNFEIFDTRTYSVIVYISVNVGTTAAATLSALTAATQIVPAHPSNCLDIYVDVQIPCHTF